MALKPFLFEPVLYLLHRPDSLFELWTRWTGPFSRQIASHETNPNTTKSADVRMAAFGILPSMVARSRRRSRIALTPIHIGVIRASCGHRRGRLYDRAPRNEGSGPWLPLAS